MEIYKLYNGDVLMHFDPEKHIYTVDGERVEGVTGVTGVIAKPALIQWAVNKAISHISECITPGESYDELKLKKFYDKAKFAHKDFAKDAADLGTLVHNAIETFIKTGKETKLVNEKAQHCFKMFLDWAKDNKVEFLASERKVFSRKYKYAGTMDFLCKIGGELYAGDVKTSSGIWDEYWFQVAAYQQAYEEETGEKILKRVIVRVGKDASFDVQIRNGTNYEQDAAAFNGALVLYKRINQIRDEQKGNK